MSEKSNKIYRYVWRNLERNALTHYGYLTFFQKFKWGFIKRNMLNGTVKITSRIIISYEQGDKRK